LNLSKRERKNKDITFIIFSNMYIHGSIRGLRIVSCSIKRFWFQHTQWQIPLVC